MLWSVATVVSGEELEVQGSKVEHDSGEWNQIESQWQGWTLGKKSAEGGYWWIEIRDKALILVFHDVMASVSKAGSNWRFFGVDTADFVACIDGTWAIPVPVISHFRTQYLANLRGLW